MRTRSGKKKKIFYRFEEKREKISVVKRIKKRNIFGTHVARHELFFVACLELGFCGGGC